MKFTLFFLLSLTLSFANSQSCWEAADKKQLFSTTRTLDNSYTCKLDNGDNVVVWVIGDSTQYTIHYSVNGYKGTLVNSNDRFFRKIQVLCGNNEIHVAWDWYSVSSNPYPKGVKYATYSITETQQESYDATLVGNIVDFTDNVVLSFTPTEIKLESFLKTENGVAALIMYQSSYNGDHQISVYENSQLSFKKSTVSTTEADALLLQKSNGNFIMVGYDSNACSTWYCKMFIEEFADTNVVTDTPYSATTYLTSAHLSEIDTLSLLYVGENGLQLSVGENNVVVDSYSSDKTFVYSYNDTIVVFYLRDDVNNEFRDIHLNEYNLDLTPISNKTIVQGLDENIMSVVMTPTSGAVFFQVDSNSFDVKELSMTCGTSSPPPTTTTTAAPVSDDEGLGVGAIVGISAGAVVVVAGVVWFVMRQGASAGYTLMTDSSGGRIDI